MTASAEVSAGSRSNATSTPPDRTSSAASAADTARKVITEEIEVKLRNRKEEPVKVIVKENLYRWVNWRIVSSTHAYEKQDARTIHIPVNVPADKEVVVRYTVRYTW